MDGVIAAKLDGLRALKSLILSGNNFNGPIPKNPSTVLEQLQLSMNSFQGTISDQIIGYSNLTLIDLSQNKLSKRCLCSFTSFKSWMIQFIFFQKMEQKRQEHLLWKQDQPRLRRSKPFAASLKEPNFYTLGSLSHLASLSLTPRLAASRTMRVLGRLVFSTVTLPSLLNPSKRCVSSFSFSLPFSFCKEMIFFGF